jgi:putative dimethyl sulfoxide reductase chaperone
MDLIGIHDGKTKSAAIFRGIAELYKPPTVEYWNEIKNGHFLLEIEAFATELYGIEEVGIVKALPDSLEQLIALYETTLGDIGNQAAIPVESLYKKWTMDDTCTLPIAKSKGYLQGDSALHIQFILDKLQIYIPLEYWGMPDHLAILLELLSFFIEHAQENFTEEFLADHFDWLADFERKLAEVSAHPFYPRVTRFLIDVLGSLRSSYI